MSQSKRAKTPCTGQALFDLEHLTCSISELVRLLGIPAKYKGFSFLVAAVNLALEKESRLQHITQEIYPVIAELYQTNSRCVEKNLRTAIGICWERGNTDLLNQLKGYPLKEKPSTGEFIDILVAFMQKNQPAGSYDMQVAGL